jgi:hypothetical protein
MYTKTINLLIIGLFSLLTVKAANIEIPADVIKGFNQGNATVIAHFFKGNIELTINNKENIYSSTQAELILKDFFKKNIPQSFKIIHEGGKGVSKYAIGTLKTSQGNYRITMLFKLNNNSPYIHQLRIEKDDV